MADKTLIGTMNMLGDLYNPFEFLAVDDVKFMATYSDFEAKAMAVTFADLRAHGLYELAAACDASAPETLAAWERTAKEQNREAWAAMDEPSLEYDNKYFDHRMNLIVFAMRRFDVDLATCTENGTLVWTYASADATAPGTGPRPAWWRLLERCCAVGVSYSKSPHLMAWDLLCCVIAAESADSFTEACRTSYLNPDNTEAQAKLFVETATTAASRAGAAQCVLGLQEFPQAETPRAVVFEAAFRSAGFEVIRTARSAALAHRGFDGPGEVLAVGGDPERGTVDSAAVMRTLTRDADGEPKYDKKITVGFECTTALKILSVRLGGVVYHALHAKEPKTPAAVKLLVKFLITHAMACGAGPFVWLLDSNIAKEKLDEAFHAAVEANGLCVSRSVPTTSKRRSRLHGQCYDDAKCHKTVKGPKDKFVVAAGDTLELLPTVPDLADETHPVTLPRASWPTDHAFVAALYVGAAA
jgi:hypothetical protein